MWEDGTVSNVSISPIRCLPDVKRGFKTSKQQCCNVLKAFHS